MHLGFHYHTPALAQDNGVYLPGYLGRFIDSIAPYCEQITCFFHTPTESEIVLLDYRLHSPNVNLVSMGIHNALPKRLLTASFIAKKNGSHITGVDVFLLRAPTPLLPVFAKEIKQVPIVLLLVGDILMSIADSDQPLARKKLIHAFWSWNQLHQHRLIKNNLTFVNSHQLYEQLQGQATQLVETRTTTLSTNDFFLRENTCASLPIHLLYVGRIEKVKGIFELLSAVTILLKKGYELVLDLVGWAVDGDNIIEVIKQILHEKKLGERVVFHGYKALGDELFQYYKDSDIYVSASYSEGFPRTIWEAMAHSLPVVSTGVGSIADYAGDAVEIVAPQDVTALANGIERVLRSAAKRKEMIVAGQKLARENTLEKRAEELMTKIREFYGKD